MDSLEYLEMRRIVVWISALVMVISGILFTASAQDTPSPEEQAATAIDQRKSLFKTLRYNLAPIAGMAQGAPFNAQVAERNARRIAVMATMIPEMLAVNTAAFDNIETTALDIIWDNQDDIAVKAQALMPSPKPPQLVTWALLWVHSERSVAPAVIATTPIE